MNEQRREKTKGGVLFYGGVKMKELRYKKEYFKKYIKYERERESKYF